MKGIALVALVMCGLAHLACAATMRTRPAHDKVGAYVLAQSYMAGCDRTKDLVTCLGAAMFFKGIDS